MAKLAAEESAFGVLRVAVLSRLLLLTLISLSRLLFDPYDTSAPLNPPCLSAAGGGEPSPAAAVRWPRVGAAVEASVVWDGVYFVRIAECGYEYEQAYAFFPLLPASIALLAQSAFAPLVPMIGYRAVLALSGYVINNVAFLFAAMYFYRLSVILLKDSATALRASVLFCFNPASVFYSSIYSESLYTLLSLGGVFYLFSGSSNVAMLLFALSGSARSNGALNAGYFCFQAMCKAYDAFIQKRNAWLAVQALIEGVVYSVCIFAPFVAFQTYGYLNICGDVSSDASRPWCRARVPNMYGYLQSHYWGVGFLRYFQVKQLPNFLLASPMLSLAACSIAQYARVLPQVFQSLHGHELKVLAARWYSIETNQSSDSTSKSSPSFKSHKGDNLVRQRKQDTKEKDSGISEDAKLTEQEALFPTEQGYYSIAALPFILHLGFMTFTALFVMHVQVATRFLSASPPIYWFASNVLASPSTTSRRWGYLIWVYFISYILLGSLLFSNFYPFT